MRPVRWITGSIGLALGLLLAFQVLERHPARALPPGHFYTGVTERPADLNPFTTRGQVARNYVLRYTHDALMDWDPETAVLREALAKSVVPHPDGVTFDFTLRDDVRFADGSPLTMEDVLFTWEVFSDSNVPMGTMGADLGRVGDVQVLPGQPDRLRVILDEPYFAGLESFAPAWTVVHKRYFLAEIARLARDAGRPVPVEPGDEGFGELLAMVKLPGPGSGPYQLESGFQSGALSLATSPDLYLVQNPDSWRRRVCDSCWDLEGFGLLFLSDAAAIFTELLKGNLDWYSTADPEDLFERYPRLRDRYTAYTYDYRNLGQYWIAWNLRREPLDDVRVRQALSMLFKREEILSALMGGNGDVAVSYFKPGTPYYPDDSMSLPYDPIRAGELLREAGFGGNGEPLRIRITVPSGSPIYRRVLDLARPAFDQVEEVELEVQTLEWSALVERRGRRDFDGLFYHQGHGAWVDPFPEFHSSQAGANGQNFMGYDNSEVDGILEEFRRDVGEVRRIELAQQFNAIIHEEQPATFLVHPRVSVLVNRDIEGVKPGPLGLFPERWSVPVELQRK